jgi:hypothetical protein
MNVALRDGTSIQLEYPGSKINGMLRPILTYKSSFTHGTNSYIVGWYVPIDNLDEIPPDVDRVHLCQEIDQVKFRLALASDKKSALTAELGEAVKDALIGGGDSGLSRYRRQRCRRRTGLKLGSRHHLPGTGRQHAHPTTPRC